MIGGLINAEDLLVNTQTDGGYLEKNLTQTVDAMDLDAVAESLRDLFGDDCACNFCGNDEWLPEVCDYADCGCPNLLEDNGCWKQFVKHWPQRKLKHDT